VSIDTLTADRALEKIGSAHALRILDTVVVENPEADRPVFARPRTTARGMLKIARNVGMVQEATLQLVRRIRALGIEPRLVPPRRAGKVKGDEFRQITRWTARTSQHGRDAAMLVFGK